MKVLQVNKYNYRRGGSEAVFLNTTRLLQAHGHTVVKWAIKHPLNDPDPHQDYFIDFPEIRDLGGWDKAKSAARFISNRDAARTLDRLLAAEKPDVAHLHNIFNSFSLTILPVLKRHGVPVVITIHDTRFICPSAQFGLRGTMCDNCLKWGGLNCALHRCYEGSRMNSLMCALEMFNKEKLVDYDRYIDRYIFVSERYKQLHAQRHSYFSNKGTVLYNFAPDIDNISIRPSARKYLLYYGRIAREKGVETLLDAMRNLPQHTLKVVGDGPLLDTLRQQAPSNVEFMGYKSGNELFDIVRDAAYVVVPSQWEENNPMTIIEAYSHGIPVLGSRMGGIPEIIEEGRTGFIFTPFDSHDLARAIDTAMQLPAEQHRDLCHHARTFAMTNFHSETHYHHLLAIYQQSIAQSSSR